MNGKERPMTATEHTMPSWLEAAWMQRYLARELTSEETEWFEVYVLDKPALLTQIEADLDLRDGMAAGGSLAPAALQTADRQSEALAAPRRPRRTASLWLARAAGVVVSASLGWLMATSYFSAPTPEGDEVVGDPARIVFDTQRGTQDAALVFNAVSASRYLLVEVAVPMDATDVQLVGEGQPALALSITSEGFVTFLWPRAALATEATPELSYRSTDGLVTRELDLAFALKGDER